MMLLLLFGGFLLNKERVPAYCRWLSGTSLFNYAYEVGAFVGCTPLPVNSRAASVGGGQAALARHNCSL